MVGVFYLVDFSGGLVDPLLISSYAVVHFGLMGAVAAVPIGLLVRLLGGADSVTETTSRLLTGVAVVLALSIYYIVARRPTLLLEPGTLLPIVAGVGAVVVWAVRRENRGRDVTGRSFALSIVACLLLPALWAQARPVLVDTPAPADVSLERNTSIPTNRVLLLGWDAATWDLVDPMLRDGRLPTLAKLIEGGARGTVDSEPQEVQPFEDSSSAGTRTPAIFETIATGKPPIMHGIWDFQAKMFWGTSQALPFRVGGGWLGPHVPTTSDMARAERVWHMVDRAGLETLVVGWWNTWPVRHGLTNGVLVSDRAKEEIPDTMAPADAVDVAVVCAETRSDADRAVEGLVPALDPNLHTLGPLKEDLRRTFRNDYQDDLCHYRLAAAVAAERDPEFIATYVSLIDIVQHKFWRYFEPDAFGDVEKVDAEQLGHAIAASYDFADDLLAKMLEAFGPDTTVVLVSDHGAGAWAFDGMAGALKDVFQSIHPEYSGNHRLNGLIVMNGPGVAAGVDIGVVKHVDIVPTVLALLGLPLAEDLPGRVLNDAFEAPELRASPLQRIRTYQTAESEGSLVPTASAVDSEVEKKLRALGYIQ
jgi:predicted AlkP superfamily phosphohydrolase/phosphomutase